MSTIAIAKALTDTRVKKWRIGFVEVVSSSRAFPKQNYAKIYVKPQELRVFEIYRERREGYYASDLILNMLQQADVFLGKSLEPFHFSVICLLTVENGPTNNVIHGKKNGSDELRDAFMSRTPLGKLVGRICTELDLKVESVDVEDSDIVCQIAS